MTLGEFVAFSRYLVLLSWPLIAFGWVINLVQRGVASWERMLEILDAPVRRRGGGLAPPRAEPVRGDIEARHLTFRYPGSDADALHDVSFVDSAGPDPGARWGDRIGQVHAHPTAHALARTRARHAVR